jgi:UDP-glucose 4-epimerase
MKTEGLVVGSSKKVFVTGGAGFIGSHLVRSLVSLGYRVAIGDNFRRNAMKTVFPDCADHVEVVDCDVRDAPGMTKLIGRLRPDQIVHCAGIAGVDTVAKAPVETVDVNFTGTSNVLAAAVAAGSVERVVCLSTSEVFGTTAYRPTETTPASVGPVGEPRWVYAVSKLGAEHLAFAYFKQHGLGTVTLRPFNVYGPGQVGEGAISAFVSRAIRDEPMVLYGDGAQIRSWCFVSDMVDSILASLEVPEAIGKAFNIGNPRATLTMFGLAEAVKSTLASKSDIVFQQKEGADVMLRTPDIGYAESILGFSPKVDLAEGITKTAEDYRLR